MILYLSGDAAPYPFRRDFYDQPANESLFIAELLKTLPYLTDLKNLTISWGHEYEPSIAMYQRVPSTALATYAPVLGELWASVAPRVRTLQLDVYIDALESLAVFNSSIALHLTDIKIHVYGGVWPTNTSSSVMRGHLAKLARTLVLPAAPRLTSLSTRFLPRSDQHYRERDGLPVDGFFQELAAASFPRLHSLDSASPFTEDSGNETEDFVHFVTELRREGVLEQLALAPTFSQGWGYSKEVQGYLNMLSSHAKSWYGLRRLQLYVLAPEPRRVDAFMEMERDGMAVFDVESLPDRFETLTEVLLSLVSGGVEEVRLTGDYLEPDALRSLLGRLALRSSSPLRHLTVQLTSVYPSTLDDLALFAPRAESLTIVFEGRAMPDTPPTEAAIDLLEHDEALVSSLRIWTESDPGVCG
jgi:hypothetical protein